MELTEEEKKLFRQYDKALEELPSYHIEKGLIESHSSNNEEVKITYAYIKRILMQVAKNRGIVVSENETFDFDNLLRKIVEVPDELPDFNPLYYKNPNAFNKYVDTKTKGMNSEEIESFLYNFTGVNGMGGMNDSFRFLMANYISRLDYKIDKLNFETEVDDISSNDDEWWVVDEDDEKEAIKIEDKNESEEEEWIDFEEEEDWPDFEELEDVEPEFAEIEIITDDKMDSKVTDEELIDLIRYVNSFPQLIEYKNNGKEISEKLNELFKKTKLNEFYSNKSFLEDFKRIMEHDKKSNIYHFHGTQDLESANTIINEGLGMMREALETTSYQEFTMDEVILYRRGLGGEIGNSAVVIIDEPIEDDGKKKKIVEPMSSRKKIHFCPSGLQGLNGKPKYIVDPKYIVGYVDKVNKTIIFNPKYYAYDKFNLQEEIKEQKQDEQSTQIKWMNSMQIMDTKAMQFESRVTEKKEMKEKLEKAYKRKIKEKDRKKQEGNEQK